MKWMKKYAQKHILAFSVLLTIVSIGLLYICKFGILKGNVTDYDFISIIVYSVPMIFVVGMCYHSGYINYLKFFDEGISKSFELGWLFLIDGIYEFIFLYSHFDKSHISMPSVEKFIYFTIVMLMVSVFEEVLCRGIMLNNMLKKWGQTKSGVIKSVILSSLIFALGSFANLIVFPNLFVRTSANVIYTFLTGILFAAIYLRCKEIWGVIFLHAVYDGLNQVVYIYSKVSTTAQIDYPALSVLSTFTQCIPFALVGFFLLRKVWTKDTAQYKEKAI